MMRRRRLAPLALAAVSLTAFAQSIENEPSGFRGLTWGDAPSAELVRGATERNLTFYSRPSDKLAIGEATLESIRYGFYKGRFAGVVIQLSGAANGRALLRALEAQFGRAHRANPYIDDWRWRGPTASIGMSCKAGMQQCSASILSAAHIAEQIRDQNDAANKAKGDF